VTGSREIVTTERERESKGKRKEMETDAWLAKALVAGAILHIAALKYELKGAKRENVKLKTKEMVLTGLVGALGAGLRTMAAHAFAPDSTGLYCLGIVVGMVTYDHFLLL